jgi:hypothetical protein
MMFLDFQGCNFSTSDTIIHRSLRNIIAAPLLLGSRLWSYADEL